MAVSAVRNATQLALSTSSLVHIIQHQMGVPKKGVGQIKGLLEKIGRKNILSQDELNKLVFKLNSNVSLGGSALQRFFARDVGTYQPTLMRKKLDHAALMQKKMDHQLGVAKKLGRRSVDDFKEGDAVVAQNIRTGKWRNGR